MTVKALAIGDFHIPSRSYWIPESVELEVKKERYDLVLCTGDLTSEDVIYWLERLGGKVYVVRGNMDHLRLPTSISVKVEELRVGLYHGAGVYPRGDVAKLTAKARQMGVDILVTGHTHYPEVVMVEGEGILIVNPGSATGAWGGDERATMIPSFAVLTVDSRRVEVKIKEVLDGDVRERTWIFNL